MNTDSMSFRYEEHFPSYESNFFAVDEESQSGEELFGNVASASYWDWEVEQENNGDIALIPMSSNVGMNYLSNSPPAREDFQKIMSEWQHLINSEVSELDSFSTDISLTDISENVSEVGNMMPPPKIPFSGKKIDLNAHCYIVNDSTQLFNTEFSEIKSEEKDNENIYRINNIKTEDHDSENDFVDVDTVTDGNTPILQACDVNSLLEQFEATESYQPELSIIKHEIKEEVENPNNESVDKSKQILDALPQELIMKIKASSKRRIVPVIDAMPNKKRNKKVQNDLISTITYPDGLDKSSKTESIQLDHDYCSQISPYPKHPQKDSGFESAEEDEQRSILKKQPTVKGADGKLMISLLKVNTISNSIVTECTKAKRKLNLEEYKKRREGIARICAKQNSSANSPIGSGATSPVVVEDEHMRLLKHQQKLMQMAEEVLKTPPKSATLNIQNPIVEASQLPVIIPPTPTLPSNIEVKVLVSMGVNTVLSNAQVQPSELEDIKPILQSANKKINNNSLITSVIKSVQKLKPNVVLQNNNSKESKSQEHGEDKTIAYLDKCRPPVETKNVEVQTEPELEDTTKHKRSRTCSSSSGSSSEQRKLYKRSTSTESHYSYSSRSSSASSRSRSRSRSPPRIYTKKRSKDLERERIREVEERRIVYVGGISLSATKESLRRRFQMFGPITNVSVHFREYGGNYGFVTYMYKDDAYKAVEHGNDDPMLPKYDLSFGGRRIFCRTHYSDLDNMQDIKLYQSQVDDSFDNLLREAKAKLRKRKSNA